MDPVTLKEARTKLGDLVDAAEHGETIVITRRGREVARLVPPEKKGGRLPDLTEFRASIKSKGIPLSDLVIALRNKERA